MPDSQKMARMLIAGLYGALPGWLLGLEGADCTAGVLDPIVAQLKAVKAHHTPGLMHPGPIWQTWVHHRDYLPTHWGALWHHPDLLLGAIGLGLLTGGWLAYHAGKGTAVSWGGPQAAGKGQHGTAHWRNPGSLSQSAQRWQAPLTKQRQLQTRQQIHQNTKKGQTPPAGLLLGTTARNHPRTAWILARDEHALVVGATGVGKSRRVIIPSIGIIGTAGTESLVIADPKGEVYDHTAQWLETRGYRVIRLDLIHPQPGWSRQFNPITPVWQALHSGPSPDYARATRGARQVAHLITFGGEGNLGSTDPLWINGQISLMTAVILWVADGAEDPGDCHLHQVYRVLVAKGSENEGKGLDACFTALPLDHPARHAYATYQLAQGKTRSSIITTAASSLQLWGDPDVAWLTADQDHDLESMGQEPTAVFLVVPFEDTSRYMIAGLYVNMLFRALTEVARQHQGRLPTRVNFLLDEFGNLPPFPDFDQFVTVSRSLGIRLVLALQNLEQLKKHYAQTERTIRGNLRTWLYLLTADLQSAKELSEMIGRYTTHSESSQMPKVSLFNASASLGHTSQGLSLTGRELVTADELMRWPPDTVLVWQAGHPPAKLPLPDLSQWRIFPDLQQRQPFTGWPVAPASSVPAGKTETEITRKGGDPMVSASGPANPDIPVDALGAFASCFAQGQEALIDPDDTPER